MDVIIALIKVKKNWQIAGVFSSDVHEDDVAKYGEFWKKKLGGSQAIVESWVVQKSVDLDNMHKRDQMLRLK